MQRCLERYVIHIIHWIICYHRNVFLLIYEHALAILSSYPSTLHCCIKKSFIVRVLHKHVVLFGHWLDFVCDCDFFINVAFVCAFVTWIKDYLFITSLTVGHIVDPKAKSSTLLRTSRNVLTSKRREWRARLPSDSTISISSISTDNANCETMT